MLDLDKIRALLASYRSSGKVGSATFNAAKGYTLPVNTKEIHLGAPEIIEALLSEVDELHTATGPYLILDEREGIIGIVEATDPDDAWAKFQAANPGDYDGDPDDNEVVIEAVTLEWCDKMVDWLTDAHEKIYRLTSELSATQTELYRSRVSFEWEQFLGYEQSLVGAFSLTVHANGWRLSARPSNGPGVTLVTGPETGKEGKTACIAAYYRAIGLPCP